MKLGDISPLAGMLTGEGFTGKLISQGVGGAIPAMIARQAQKEAEEKERRKKAAAEAERAITVSKQKTDSDTESSSPMKKGGKVGSASKRADGIAKRGKTRGKMY